MAASPGRAQRTYILQLPHSPPLPIVFPQPRPKAIVFYPVITAVFLVIDLKKKVNMFLEPFFSIKSREPGRKCTRL